VKKGKSFSLFCLSRGNTRLVVEGKKGLRVVERPLYSRANVEVGAPRESLGDIGTGSPHGSGGVQTPGQKSRDCGGGGAPRAVGIAGFYSGAPQYQHLPPIEENVCKL
jgi:hypothetical protein